MKNGKFALILLVLIMLGACLRFYDLTADPFSHDVFGTTQADEGAWVHNARNLFLFGEPTLSDDLWNPMYISPLHTYFTVLSFNFFGVNTFGARFMPALLNFLAILFAGGIIYLRNRKIAFIFITLMLFNPMLIAYSRISLVESTVIFIITILASLIYYNSKVSFFFAGVLTPFLFFSKLTTAFLIASFPLSLFIYFLLFHEKSDLYNFCAFLLGSAISLIAWLFWWVPNLGEWFFMNFGGYSRLIGFSLFTVFEIIVRSFKFLSLNILIVLILLFYLGKRLKEQAKISHLDLFVIITLILFTLQIFIVDSFLRRFVMIIPLLALVAAKSLSSLKEIRYKNKEISISGNVIIAIILTLYILSSSSIFIEYFAQSKVHPQDSHTYLLVSDKLGDIIPANSAVYGGILPSQYALENKLKPYYSFYSYSAGNNFEHIFPLIRSGRIDFFMSNSEVDSSNPFYKHILTEFKLVATLNTKDWRDGSPQKLYLYKNQPR